MLALLESVAPMLPLAIVLAFAVVVLISIAFDLRRLRRNARLRTIHGVTGAAFTAVVIGGALAMSLALGSAATATAEQPRQDVPTLSSVPEPALIHAEPIHAEPIDTGDVTDPSTDIQLPTLGLDEE